MSPSAPVRVRLRYADLDTFVERFAPNVTRGGVFLASRAPRAVGAQFPFEIQLASGQVALAGEGKVIWIKEFNPAEPMRAHGMGLQFLSLSAPSRELIARMLKVKGALGGTGAPRGFTQPFATVADRRGNGAASARRRVDTNVDLAAEFGLEEVALRRAVDRAWLPGGTARAAADADLQSLLKPEVAEPATLMEALGELRRMLAPTARRRSGSFRTLEGVVPLDKTSGPLVVTAVSVTSAAPAAVENGVASHAPDDQG